MAQGVPGKLRPRIYLTFGTTRVVGRQPYAPVAFTPAEIPGTHFSEAESTSGHMVRSEFVVIKPVYYDSRTKYASTLISFIL